MGMPSEIVEQRSQRENAEQEGHRTQKRCCDGETALENESSNIASVERLLPSGPDKYCPDER
jgi:methylphosphotriester-DNA--protein-cysteine methyltransferase